MTASLSPMSWRQPRPTCRSVASRRRSRDSRRPARLLKRRKRPEAASRPWRPVLFSFDSSKGFARAASLAVAAAGFTVGLAHAAGLGRVDVGAPAPLFTAKGADGKQHSLRDYAGKLVVLEWTNPVCPFTAVKYKSGAMQALQRYAASRQVVWLSIDTPAPDKAGYLTAAAARSRIAQTYATVTAFLFDVDGNI